MTLTINYIEFPLVCKEVTRSETCKHFYAAFFRPFLGKPSTSFRSYAIETRAFIMRAPNATSTRRKKESLPELPTIGNQKKWNIAKIAIRSIALSLEATAICLSIALAVKGAYYSNGVVLALPIVSAITLQMSLPLTTLIDHN